ncbi:MAG: hypothetical protein AAB638_03020 [Patescibacteria group bacterium]
MESVTQQAEQEQDNPIPAPSHKSFTRRFIFWALSLIIISGIGYANLWYYSIGPSSDSALAQKMFWKPYVNKQFGFVFRYPANFTLQESHSEDGITHARIPEVWADISLISSTNTDSPESVIQIGINNETISYFDEKSCKVTNSEIKNIKIGDLEVSKRVVEVSVGSGCPAPKNIEYKFSNSGNTYRIGGVIHNDLERKGVEGMAEKIISTFKFPNPPEFVFCGGVSNVKCSSGFTCRLPELYPEAGGMCVPQATPVPTSWACFRPQYLSPYCPKAITTAKNIKTGEIKQFPDGCLPSCWMSVPTQ